jgi:hypothetical protein
VFPAAVRADDKPAALLWLVREGLPQGSSTLVFASTRHHVEFLHNLMSHEGVPAACVFGSMDQVRLLGCSVIMLHFVNLVLAVHVAAAGAACMFGSMDQVRRGCCVIKLHFMSTICRHCELYILLLRVCLAAWTRCACCGFAEKPMFCCAAMNLGCLPVFMALCRHMCHC